MRPSALFAVSLALSLWMTASVSAADKPIVELMPIVAEMRDQLVLDEQQGRRLDGWMTEAPARQQAVAEEIASVRSELRELILGSPIDGSTRRQRDALKAELARLQTQQIELRVLCTRLLSQTLRPADFERVVAVYRSRQGI